MLDRYIFNMLSSLFQGDVDTHKGDPGGRHLRLSLYSQFTGTNIFYYWIIRLRLRRCVSTTTMATTNIQSYWIYSNLTCTPIFRFSDIFLFRKVTLELCRPTQ